MFIYKCLSCGYELCDDSTSEDFACPKCGKKMLRVKPPMKLGEVLVYFELVNADEVEKALSIQKKINHHYPLGRILVKLGIISTIQLHKALEFQREIFLGIKP